MLVRIWHSAPIFHNMLHWELKDIVDILHYTDMVPQVFKKY